MTDERTTPAPTVEPAAGLAGDPDGMQRLWTPHRMAYLGGQDKPTGAGADECPFCRAPGRSDEDGLMVARGERAFVVLNLYPYNSGHAMVLPYRHVADYTDLDATETVEVAELTQTAMRVIRAVYGAQGFNLGMNQGTLAGSGLAAPVHEHVVPRWAVDANFQPIVAGTKALPELLSDTRRRLADAWPAAEGSC